MENTIAVPKMPNYHPITSALINTLKAGKVGDTLTDLQLKEIAGVDVSPQAKHCAYLYTAIRYCINHVGIVWQRIRKSSSISCLNSSEIVSDSTSEISRLRRRSHRAQKKLYAVKLSELSADDQRQFAVNSAQISAVHLFAGKRAHDKLIETGKTELPKLEDISNLFK